MFLLKFLEMPLLYVFLGGVDTYCFSDSAIILFFKGRLCSIERNILETLYIDEEGGPDQVHYVSIKILEIPLFKRIPGEVDTHIVAVIAP